MNTEQELQTKEVKDFIKAQNTQFKELRQFAIKEIEQRHTNRILKIKDETQLKEMMSLYRKTYKKNAQKKFYVFLEKKKNKEIQELNIKIDEVSNAKEFYNDSQLIITVEWRDSRMWRSNPKAYTNYGFEGESIGGCGYDKLSTATAQALNSDKRLLKLMYAMSNEALKKNKSAQLPENHKILGYGSGYGILPHFEDGVGVSCHQHIIEKIGLKMECVTDTKNTDVYIIKRVQQ